MPKEEKKKVWTRESFIEECNKIMELRRNTILEARQNWRRGYLKKVRNKHAKSKLQ